MHTGVNPHVPSIHSQVLHLAVSWANKLEPFTFIYGICLRQEGLPLLGNVAVQHWMVSSGQLPHSSAAEPCAAVTIAMHVLFVARVQHDGTYWQLC